MKYECKHEYKAKLGSAYAGVSAHVLPILNEAIFNGHKYPVFIPLTKNCEVEVKCCLTTL